MEAHTVTLQFDTFGNVIFLKSPLVERVGEVYRSHHHVAESGQYPSQTPPKLITIVQITKKLSNKVYVTIIFPVHGIQQFCSTNEYFKTVEYELHRMLQLRDII